jgi:hypothetical protein
MMRSVALQVMWAFVVIGIVSSPTYDLIVKGIIAGPPAALAGRMTDVYLVDFAEDVGGVFGQFGASKEGVRNIVTATFDGSLVSSILASIVFAAVAILVFLLPLLIGKLMLLVYLVGPICLMFSLCEWTLQVAKNWLGAALTIAWTAFFASAAMLIITKADIMAKCSEGAGWSEVITVIVYGVIGIVLMIGSYMISRELFGGLGGGVVNTLSSPSAAVGATAVGGAAVVGGQAAAASFGGGMLRGAGGYLSSQGARLGDGGAGKMMSSVGAGLSRIGTVLHNPVSRGISVAAAKPGSATGTANMAGQGMAGTGRRGSGRADVPGSTDGNGGGKN